MAYSKIFPDICLSLFELHQSYYLHLPSLGGSTMPHQCANPIPINFHWMIWMWSFAPWFRGISWQDPIVFIILYHFIGQVKPMPYSSFYIILFIILYHFIGQVKPMPWFPVDASWCFLISPWNPLTWSEVYPFADATFFCAATAKEAMVWLVQAGVAICLKHV